MTDSRFTTDRDAGSHVAEPNSPAGRAFMTVAERAAAQVSIKAHAVAEANKGKIPLIQVR